MRRRDFIVAVGGVIVSPPIAALAQKPIIPVVGYLGAVSQRPNLPFTAAFIRGLVETGFTEGRDFIVDYRWAEGNLDRLPGQTAARNDPDHQSSRVDLQLGPGRLRRRQRTEPGVKPIVGRPRSSR